MDNEENIENKEYASKEIRDFCHELVLLNYIYERKMVTKDEMLAIRANISKRYGQSNHIFVD